ncbi:hypothetical protein ABH944_007773 [Caballeronia udeis]|uniref:Uncharacterized protein n=1 Tax=Caballeronia udeis TaxID=1232866 RepID=A0ABW8MUT2_9BURK
MYTNLVDPKDGVLVACDPSLKDVAREAVRLCSPDFHGFFLHATIEDMSRLSLAVTEIEERYNAEGKKRMDELGFESVAMHGHATTLAFDRGHIDPAKLPPPFSECIDAHSSDMHRQPYFVMLFAAQALTQIDRAATLINSGKAAEAIRHLCLASVSLVHACDYAGMQTSERETRIALHRRKAELGALGGRARSERYGHVRDWVIEHYLSKPWASARQAAQTLYPEALKLSQTLGMPLSEDRAFQTVYDWIREAKKNN